MPQQPTYTVTRETRGTAHWIHIHGPNTLLKNAGRKAGAEARKWAKELGKHRAYAVSSGAAFTGDTFRYSVCYSFED